MSNIIIPSKKNTNKLKNKDCNDFKPMDDGTLTGDTKYCANSFICKQIGMRSDYIYFSGYVDENIDGVSMRVYKDNMFDYLCTGIYATKDDVGVDVPIS